MAWYLFHYSFVVLTKETAGTMCGCKDTSYSLVQDIKRVWGALFGTSSRRWQWRHVVAATAMEKLLRRKWMLSRRPPHLHKSLNTDYLGHATNLPWADHSSCHDYSIMHRQFCL